jgi:hypothetical protein
MTDLLAAALTLTAATASPFDPKVVRQYAVFVERTGEE